MTYNFATLLLVFVPMPLIIIVSFISYYRHTKQG